MDTDIDWVDGTVRICAVGAPSVDCDSKTIHRVHHSFAAVVHKQAHRHPSRADMIGYPNARIEVNGFEKTQYPDGVFDIAIGNVPFGNYRVSDRPYDRHNLLIHDYFFAKTIDKVRAGGIIAFITSNGISGGTMDKKDAHAREYMARRCDLLGAVRLPNTTFRANAGTDISKYTR